jgi:arylsulfatase A-like enzyme
MISHHDHHIGRVLAALHRRALHENTYVVFTSDHGLAVGSHGLMGKENLYEHSARVPLILCGPGVAENRRLDADLLCGHYDFMPTLLDLAKVDTPASSQGRSYAAHLRDTPSESPPPRSTMAAAYRNCMRMARDSRFKLIYYPGIDRYQLFDVQNDPSETNDLLLPWRRDRIQETHPLLRPGYEPAVSRSDADEAVERLKRVLRAWQTENGDNNVDPGPRR